MNRSMDREHTEEARSRAHGRCFNGWYATHADGVFDALGLTFDLDVASPPWETHVPAARKFTKADDGLSQPWEGRVWMNPPFSKPTPWVARFIDHGNGVALLPMAKSAWVNTLWASDAALGLPRLFAEFDASRGHIQFMVMFAAFGPECVEAIGRLGRVR